MLTGTLVGSALETVVRNDEDLPTLIQIPTLFTQAEFSTLIMTIFVVPLIFGLVAGLNLMRRKDVQPFLTIEDFWGGIVVGFVAGYGGSDILSGLLATDLDVGAN